MSLVKSLEPKYYKPDIEEFHVGFEYEHNWHNRGNWEKETGWQSIHYLKRAIDRGEIRVKHLDIQDIVDLGLELVDEIDDNGEATFKWPNDSDWWLSLDDTRVEIGDIDGLVFCGFVKNKSELKRVINQVKV